MEKVLSLYPNPVQEPIPLGVGDRVFHSPTNKEYIIACQGAARVNLICLGNGARFFAQPVCVENQNKLTFAEAGKLLGKPHLIDDWEILQRADYKS